MKTALIVLLGFFCVSFARVALTDGPYWCLSSQKNAEFCTMEYSPVFAYDGNEVRTYGNECEACKVEDSYYLARSCPAGKIKCVPTGAPVCGVTASGTLVDFTDECSACTSDFEISSYFRGQCPKKLDTSISYCPPFPRNFAVMCTMIYKPVCGVDVDGNKRTLGNSCLACTTGDIVYYTEGACEEETVVKPLPVVKLPIEKPIPIELPIERPILVKQVV